MHPPGLKIAASGPRSCKTRVDPYPVERAGILSQPNQQMPMRPHVIYYDLRP